MMRVLILGVLAALTLARQAHALTDDPAEQPEMASYHFFMAFKPGTVSYHRVVDGQLYEADDWAEPSPIGSFAITYNVDDLNSDGKLTADEFGGEHVYGNKPVRFNSIDAFNRPSLVFEPNAQGRLNQTVLNDWGHDYRTKIELGPTAGSGQFVSIDYNIFDIFALKRSHLVASWGLVKYTPENAHFFSKSPEERYWDPKALLSTPLPPAALMLMSGVGALYARRLLRPGASR